jgi:hypothetical protein
VTPAELHRLARLLEARKVRDLARLDRLLAEDRRLVGEIAELGRTAKRDAAEGLALPLARQGLRLAWADQRAAAARRRREALQGAIAQARADAARSLGKHRALEKLAENADTMLAKREIARAEGEVAPQFYGEADR